MEQSVAGALVHEAHHALDGELGDRKVVLVFHAQIQVLAYHGVAVQFAFSSKDRAVVSRSARQHDRACVSLFPEFDHILVGLDVLRFAAGIFWERKRLAGNILICIGSLPLNCRLTIVR